MPVVRFLTALTWYVVQLGKLVFRHTTSAIQYHLQCRRSCHYIDSRLARDCRINALTLFGAPRGKISNRDAQLFAIDLRQIMADVRQVRSANTCIMHHAL